MFDVSIKPGAGQLTGLERVVLALFVFVLLGFGIRLAGWGPGWLPVFYKLSGVAFGLALLMYLNVGGIQRVTKSRVCTVGLVLLAFAVVGSIAGAIFDIDSPAWDIAENTVVSGFLVCFVAHVVIRLSQRTTSPSTTRWWLGLFLFLSGLAGMAHYLRLIDSSAG
ncbi:hypothetical protein [Kibdelosporangium phytohabitans]|uniref:Uncharacterized protein n=1 Tax=Kibdelosporangium phytohabitans TaxID=860235 RepID=A0A0N9I8C3_9PSEU|nr:hypothetical protein [Kibdelosporangium phytohabitans]ALG12483.1 hypothetical protein AOZ06_41485 [Kibdelosporangium phytohabitans]MBE1464077.1 hypothetical protein [Kibdelosporangium phytohabitans]